MRSFPSRPSTSVLICIFTLACGGGDGTREFQDPSLPEAAHTLPAIRPVPLTRLDPHAIARVGAAVAVSTQGSLAFAATPSTAFREKVEILDSTGALIGRVGPEGAGPGELIAPLFLAFTQDSSLLVWDMGTARVTLFLASGAVRQSLEPGQFQFPLALIGDSLDLREVSRPEAPIVRRPFAPGQARELVRLTDPMVDSLFPVQSGGGIQSRGPIAYAAGAGRIALGSIVSYELLLFASSGQLLGKMGRRLPPQYPTPDQITAESLALSRQPAITPARRAAMLRRSRETPLLPFRDLRFDGRGRLWVMRIDRGTATADVYSDLQFLGSIAIDCPGFTGTGWDLVGEWLVLSCAVLDPNAPSDATLRLYRIEG